MMAEAPDSPLGWIVCQPHLLACSQVFAEYTWLSFIDGFPLSGNNPMSTLSFNLYYNRFSLL